MEGLKKNLHITLAHQYPGDQHQKLEKLAGELNLKANVRWDFRLYSRDPQLANSEVSSSAQVIHNLPAELEDYTFMIHN